MMDEKPKRESSRTSVGKIILIVGISLFACIAFVVALVVLVLNLTQPVVDAGNAYMQAVQDGRLDDAYAMFAPSLQDEVSYDDYFAVFADDNLESWSINQRAIENGIGTMAGSAIFDGQSYSYELYFREIDGTWLVIGYNFELSG